MNGQEWLKDPFPNAAQIVDDVGFEGHARAQGTCLAKSHDMLGCQFDVNSVERLVALRGSHQGCTLTMWQILWCNGCAAHLQNAASGQSKLLIRVGGQAKPHLLSGLNEAGGASGRKQSGNQGVCLWAG